MERIGVFVCHCKLMASIDTQRVVDAISQTPGVAHVAAHEDLCLAPGMERMKEAISEHKLDGVVVTSCSPVLHDAVVRDAITSAGLEPHQMELVDVRSHNGVQEITEKAIESIEKAIEQLKEHRPLVQTRVPITKKVLVIGGGIAGIRTSLDIADGGYPVILVERTHSIGGHMIQYSETFPTLDCPQCIETPLMTDTGQHPNITILAHSEIEEVSGRVGEFKVKVRRKAAYVDWDKCNGCLMCTEKCPPRVLSEYNRDLDLPKRQAHRRAIWVPHAQAVPMRPIIDKEHCLHFTKGKCGVCQDTCPNKAIDFDQQDSFVDIEVGAIVVATGFELMPKSHIKEYDLDPDILEGIEFERILCPAGPTAGKVIRPSDGKEPQTVVFVSCCGSRDPEHGVPYCSRVCCMYLVKMALLYKHVVHHGQAFIFYIDIRTTGKGYEEFVQRAVEEDGVLYIRGKVSRIFRDGDKLKIWGSDTLSGKRIDMDADLVVLGMAMLPAPGAQEIADKLGIELDQNGFMTELHPKLRPLETSVPGIYLAGTCQGPKDIQDSVAQGGGAASKVLALFAQDEVILEEAATG
ncbi:MAG: CoB--CoM heterodisulfide reductase iron-sulfur subunit A family protein [Chloroflexota bacterium]|nr:CoB--CoM heterodisulfide reductase iron-sulfur subunit A family protein [Chloroflexota bacterium]